MTLSLSRRVALAALVAAVCAVGCKKSKPTDAGGDTGTPGAGPGTGPGASAPPAGWSEVRDTVGGYRVFLLGTASQVNYSKADRPLPLQPTTFNGSFRDPNADIRTKSESILPPPGLLGTSPDELFAVLKTYNGTIDAFYLPPEKTPVTLGGRPALKVVLKRIPAKLPKPPTDDPPALKHWQEEADKAKKDADRREVYFITATATRFIVIEVKAPTDPDPAFLKTLTDSFTFL